MNWMNTNDNLKKKPQKQKKQNKKVGGYLGTYVQYVSLD